MTEDGFECLRRAVNLARDEQIATSKKLVSRLHEDGWETATIQEALNAWTGYQQSKAA